MKYFLLCDFSTFSCDRSKVAEILEKNEITYQNINNFVWELNVPTTFGHPFMDSTAECIHYLFNEYADRNSIILVVKADEYYPIAD